MSVNLKLSNLWTLFVELSHAEVENERKARYFFSEADGSKGRRKAHYIELARYTQGTDHASMNARMNLVDILNNDFSVDERETQFEWEWQRGYVTRDNDTRFALD